MTILRMFASEQAASGRGVHPPTLDNIVKKYYILLVT